MGFSIYELEKLAELKRNDIPRRLKKKEQQKQARLAAVARRARPAAKTPLVMHGASGQ